MRLLLILFLFIAASLSGCGSDTTAPAANENTRVTDDSALSKAGESIDVEKGVGEEEPEQNFTKSGIETVYTDLVENKCKDVDINEDEGWSVQSCKGVGGYELLVSEGDLRQTIDVLAPNKKKYELNYWTVVSGAFSTVGDKAEWRIKKENGKVKPIALIVRYNVSENPENADEVTSYLTVSKISDSGACVTDVVKPIKNANQVARDLADVAGGKPCKNVF